jgi:hypothetical protein
MTIRYPVSAAFGINLDFLVSRERFEHLILG